MAVFTEVPQEEARALLHDLGLGELRELRGIHGGIENTNYFATTDQGEYVLTLFERLSAAQLPFYLRLMKHLAQHGIPVPEPHAMPGQKQENLVLQACGKPAAVVNRLRGHSELAPAPQHCAAVGAMLARMHLVARNFPLSQPNLRGLAWWNETVPVVLPHVDPDTPPCCEANWLSRTTWPLRPRMPPCPVERFTATCSATTCCSTRANSPASSTSTSPVPTAGCTT